MAEYVDFEIFEIIHLADWELPTVVKMRMFGDIDGEDVEKITTLVVPNNINTYDKLSIHISTYVLYPWYNYLTRPVETVCPFDGTPLQKGECMVCGYTAGVIPSV